MAAIPQPPNPGKAFLTKNEALAEYHGLLAPFFTQIRDEFSSLDFRENFGTVVTDPVILVAGVDGAVSAFVAAAFQPLLVFFRAEALDATKRPSGNFVCGAAQWSSSQVNEESGFQVVKAPGLVNGTSYAVTFLAFPV